MGFRKHEDLYESVTCNLYPLIGNNIQLFIASPMVEKLQQGNYEFDPSLLLGAARNTENKLSLQLDDSVFKNNQEIYYHAYVPNYEFCWRNLLKSSWPILDSKVLRLSCEIEFYLLSGDEFQRQEYIKAVMAKSVSLGIELVSVSEELGPNQYEIKLESQDPRKFIDQIYLLRNLMKTLIHNFQIKLSFLPKMNDQEFGSGLHFKIYFENKTTAQGVGTFFVNHADGLSVLFNPTVNSYKRLFFGTEAPKYICMGPVEYFPLVAIDDKSIEFRSSDNFTNFPAIFYVISRILEEKSFLKEALSHQELDKNPAQMSARDRGRYHIKEMPSDLGEAIRAFRLDKDLKFILGDLRHSKIIEILNSEWEKFLKVTHAWETDRYSLI